MATWGGGRKPKLRTFIRIHDFSSTQLLVRANLTRYQRSLVSQFKLGILPLKIETDRYQGIAPENRLCKVCSLNVPEDETHFLFQCPELDFIRRHELDQFDSVRSASDDIETVKAMLLRTNIKQFAIFLEKMYKGRQKILYRIR